MLEIMAENVATTVKKQKTTFEKAMANETADDEQNKKRAESTLVLNFELSCQEQKELQTDDIEALYLCDEQVNVMASWLLDVIFRALCFHLNQILSSSEKHLFDEPQCW